MKLTYRDKEWDLKGGLTARAAIEKVGLDPEAVLVVRNDKLITDDTVLQEGDEVKLIAVISGGTGGGAGCGRWLRL
ncbi:MAG TPA: MoaD/ThiS family protein [Anaerolineae bacterium]|nr:MoaD/ThiS family protein [Anaerolineae bacterium]